MIKIKCIYTVALQTQSKDEDMPTEKNLKNH